MLGGGLLVRRLAPVRMGVSARTRTSGGARVHGAAAAWCKRSLTTTTTTSPDPRNPSSKRTRRLLPPLVLLGVGCGALLTLRHVLQDGDTLPDAQTHEHITLPPGPWYLQVYMRLPWRWLSRMWGQVNDLTLPTPLRGPLYSLYSWAFDVRLDEVPEPLDSYPNLGAFFYRHVRPGTHVIGAGELVSPADARVLDFGRFRTGVTDSTEEAASVIDNSTTPECAVVKGISYSMDALLGNVSSNAATSPNTPHPGPGKALYYLVLYLAPGDYHRFHAPADVHFHTRRHIPGMLLSVSPRVVGRIPGLFSMNERVALLGTWRHGFFGFVPVGATNVGSILLHHDSELRTNVDYAAAARSAAPEDHRPQSWVIQERTYAPALHLAKGQEVGGFRLGSTVVLVFEGPEGLEFTHQRGDAVRVGEELARLPSATASPPSAGWRSWWVR